MKVEIGVICKDIADYSTDIIVLKYAQEFYGADQQIVSKLIKGRVDRLQFPPGIGDSIIVDTKKLIKSKYLLLIGVKDLYDFRYGEIRIFAKRALSIISTELPDVEHIAMTIHGVGYGLDEKESFLSQLAGIGDALNSPSISQNIKKITFVEKNENRAARLKGILNNSDLNAQFAPKKVLKNIKNSLSNVGDKSEAKPFIFVAMPFKVEMDDVFEYGIKKPINDLGYLCERVDLTEFIGDVVERIKNRIETASYIIADLSGSNPNVYLEVGYAWGKGRPTILLVNKNESLKFNVQGQNCIQYSRILDLEKALSKLLKKLPI